MTTGEYLDQWLDEVKGAIAPRTWVSYEGHVRLYLRPYLGSVELTELRPADVRRLVTSTLERVSASTTRRVVATLSVALNQAVRDELIESSVVAKVRLPRAERHQVEAMSFADADRIKEAVRGDRLEALYVLLLYSGLRLGEAIALNWQDVNLDPGAASVRVRRGKTASSARVVPLAEYARMRLIELDVFTAHGPGDPVFVNAAGGRQRADVVSHAFPRLLSEARLPRRRVHDLRHGTATLLLAAGASMREVADILGHANPATTANVYAHVTEASRRVAIERLNR